MNASVPPILLYKSLAGALLLSVFLGPVGLLYASSSAGIIMIVIGSLIVCTKLLVPVIIVWLLCCILSVLLVNRYNKKMMEIACGKKF